MARFVKALGGWEEDGLSSRAKGFYRWRPGARKWIKRKFNKRERKALRRDATDGW